MIKIEDLQQGDVLIIKGISHDYIFQGISVVDSKPLCYNTDNDRYGICDLKYVTSHIRNGVELLKKELVPTLEIKCWSDADGTIHERNCEILRYLRGLKVALKDESVFSYKHGNPEPYYDEQSELWVFDDNTYSNYGLPTFTDSSDDDRQRVIDYLNKHFNKGWSN